MAEPYDSIFDEFIAEFGDNEAEMNTVSGVIILNRNVDPDSSTVLCTRVEELLQPSKVIKQENFEWVTCGGESKELSLCEEFLNAGRRPNESALYGNPLGRYSLRGLPRVVHYRPTASTSNPLSQSKKPYFICPPGYEDAVVLIRALTTIAGQYLPVYEVPPSTTVQQIKVGEYSPGRYAITSNNILVVPHKSKIELPIDYEMKFVCQIYSTGEPSVSREFFSEDDVCPFMRRFWRPWI